MESSMRAAILKEAKGRLQIEDRAVPTPGYGEVLIKVHACGVCHGDLMVRNGEFPFVRYPIVPGHEVAGVVERLGPGVNHPKVGTRVGVPWLYCACGHCKQCVLGDEVLCAEGQSTGMTRDGGYQEFMVAQAAYVLPLPDALSFSDAAPLMCAGLSVYSGLHHARMKPNDKVAVLGLGGLGEMALQFARAMGGRVAIVSSTKQKEARARELGAEKFIHQGSESVDEALRSWDGGADIIVHVTPSPDSLDAALRGLAPDGTFVLLAPVPISVDSLSLALRRQRIMGSSSGSRKELRATLDLAAAHGIRPHTRRFPLDQASDALEELENARPAGRVVLVMDE
jgi:D-arabinose 1-dehydrogenase-like Zn-dependent alcohol dehydrogenase